MILNIFLGYIYLSLAWMFSAFVGMVWSDFRVWMWPKRYRHDHKFGANFGSTVWLYVLAALLPFVNLVFVYGFTVSAFQSFLKWRKGLRPMQIQLIFQDKEIVASVDTIKANKKAIVKYLIEKKMVTNEDQLAWMSTIETDEPERFILKIGNFPAAYVSSRIE